MRPSGSPQELERRRFRGLALLREGLSPVEVARRVGVDRRSVRRWKASVRGRGRRALAARPAPGRPQRLSAQNRCCGNTSHEALTCLAIRKRSSTRSRCA